MTIVSPRNSKLLYGTRPHAVADGVAAIAVKVKLLDSTDRPVAGVQVELYADRDGVTIEQPGLTDAAGIAIGLVRASTPGPVEISCAVVPSDE